MDPKAYEQKMIATMKERTGKTLEEWLETIRPVIPAQKNGRVKWMKETYGLGQNSVMVILAHLEGNQAELRGEAPDLVDGQYKGANTPLRPLYDALAAQIQLLGPDVVVRPCKGYVPFYRKNTFVYLQPLKGKLYAGLALPEGTEHPRLQPAAGLLTGSARIKFAVEVAGGIDTDLIGLIKEAYDRN